MGFGTQKKQKNKNESWVIHTCFGHSKEVKLTVVPSYKRIYVDHQPSFDHKLELGIEW